MKDQKTAGILALLLGGLGAHKFYLNSPFIGLLYLLFCWTGIPLIIGVIEGIQLLCMHPREFNKVYNFTSSIDIHS